jgi:hypothetical protein
MAYNAPTYFATGYFADAYFVSIAGGAPANPVQPDWRFATVAIEASAGVEPDPAFATAVLS